MIAPSTKHGNAPVAYIIGNQTRINVKQIKKYCHDHLPNCEVPSLFVLIDQSLIVETDGNDTNQSTLVSVEPRSTTIDRTATIISRPRQSNFESLRSEKKIILKQRAELNDFYVDAFSLKILMDHHCRYHLRCVSHGTTTKSTRIFINKIQQTF